MFSLGRAGCCVDIMFGLKFPWDLLKRKLGIGFERVDSDLLLKRWQIMYWPLTKLSAFPSILGNHLAIWSTPILENCWALLPLHVVFVTFICKRIQFHFCIFSLLYLLQVGVKPSRRFQQCCFLLAVGNFGKGSSLSVLCIQTFWGCHTSWFTEKQCISYRITFKTSNWSNQQQFSRWGEQNDSPQPLCWSTPWKLRR